MSNARVLVDASKNLRAIAVAAGAPDPTEIIYHEDTGELEVAGVQQANLDTALASVLSGTAPATTADKTEKIGDMAAACRAAIEGEFPSTAGGKHPLPQWYDSKMEDQLNLTGNVAAGDDTIHAHRDVQGGVKVYDSHSNVQLRQVLRDGRSVKLGHLQTFAAKKVQVLAAVTMADLDIIIW